MSSLIRAGSGEPVLLLHGFTLSHHVWHSIVDDLSVDYDVLALTMPGHWGGPRLRWSKVGVRGIADGIAEQLDALGWDTCHIIGNSLGGQVGFELERRGRARSLASINAGVGLTRFDLFTVRIGVEFVIQYPLAVLTRILGDRGARHPRLQRPVLLNSSHDIHAVSDEDSTNMMRAVSHCPAYLPSLVAFARDGMDIDLGEVRFPTSILLSEFDIYPNDSARVRRILDHLPDHIKEVRIPGVGHIPMLEDPALVARAIRTHLTMAAGYPPGPA